MKNWILNITEESLPFINKVRAEQKAFTIPLSYKKSSHNYQAVCLDDGFIIGLDYGDRLCKDRVQIDLKTFKKYYPKQTAAIVGAEFHKKMNIDNQLLSRKQLIELENKFDCSDWKKEIGRILTDNLYTESDNFVIPVSSLKLLVNKGTCVQKRMMRDMGIILPKEKEEIYLEKHNASGFKIGDVVKITRIANDDENGWQSSWVDTMNNYVGQTLTIRRDDGIYGFKCKNEANNDDYDYPYFVLEKVVEQYVPFDFSDDLLGKIVIDKAKTFKSFIYAQKFSNVTFINVDYTYDELLRGFTFLDGSICGKLKQ